MMAGSIELEVIHLIRNLIRNPSIPQFAIFPESRRSVIFVQANKAACLLNILF